MVAEHAGRQGADVGWSGDVSLSEFGDLGGRIARVMARLQGERDETAASCRDGGDSGLPTVTPWRPSVNKGPRVLTRERDVTENGPLFSGGYELYRSNRGGRGG